jgi:anti-anti-sigma factor
LQIVSAQARPHTVCHLSNDDPGSSFVVGVSTNAVQRLVVASGELDSATRQCLYEACVAGHDVSVTVDLGAVSFMDCGGYSALVDARRLLEGRGRSLTMCNQAGQPARLLADYFAPIDVQRVTAIAVTSAELTLELVRATFTGDEPDMGDSSVVET